MAQRYGRVLTVHARACSAASTSYSPPVGGRAHNLRALDEMLALARETGVKLQFSHLIFVGARTWRTVDEALRLSNRVVVLSERPARVVADIEVPEHDESSDEIRELRRRILGLLGR